MKGINRACCATRYPILLVHGFCRTDTGYWGRIPDALREQGALVFFGGQDGVATVENNARRLAGTIVQICNATGCKKMNIIAHSKGGLDARYAITRLGLAEYTASLTTLCTPHHGTALADVLCRMPAPAMALLANTMNHVFRLKGDLHPDFYPAGAQMQTAEMTRFNAATPDDAAVYYQSFAAVLRVVQGDPMLGWSHEITSAEGPNDGLVSVSSARWGRFRGLVSEEAPFGVSHQQVVDYARQDVPGFDVLGFYRTLAAELREAGF